MSTFFDTNVIVYAFHRSTDPRHATALGLVERHARDRTLVISTQVLQETYAVLTRKLGVPANVAHRNLAVLAEEQVVPSHAVFVLQAMENAHAWQMSIWDALVVTAAIAAGCKTVFTEDLQAGRRYGDVEVVNPFAPAVHQPLPTTASTPLASRQRRTARRPTARR